MFIGNSLGGFNLLKQQAKQIRISKTKDNSGVFRMDSVMKKDDTEEKVKAKLSRIRAKLMFGKKLTAEELEFLRQNDQQLYHKAIKVQMSREALKQQIKNSETKEEVQQAIATRMSGARGTNEDIQMEQAAIADEGDKAVKSSKYNKLPATKEEKRKEDIKKKKHSAKENRELYLDDNMGRKTITNEAKLFELNHSEYPEDRKEEYKEDDYSFLYTKKRKHQVHTETKSKFVSKI